MTDSANSPRIIVESAAAWRYAESLDPAHADAVWATTSPYVLESLGAEGRTAVAMDADVSQEDADRVGYVALDAACRLGRHLDADCAGWPPGLKPGWALENNLQRMLTALFYKAFLLDRFRAGLPDRAPLFTVGTTELSPVANFGTIPDRFDTIFTVIGRRLNLEAIEFDAPRPGGAQENEDFLRPTWWTRALTVVNAPFVSLLYRAWRRFGRNRAFRLYPARTDLQVGILNGNELVEEILVHLLLRGATLHGIPRYVPRRKGTAPGPDGEAAQLAEAVADSCRAAAEKHGLAWSPAFDVAAELAGDRVHRALGFGRQAAAGLEDYCAGLKERAKGGPFVILTNMLSSPGERLLHQELRKAEIPVYTVDHGTSPGQTHLHQAFYDHGMAPCVDSAISFNACAQQAEAAGRRVPETSSAVVGAPAIVRNIGLRGAQRRALRRILGVNNRLVAWVTGLYPNNLQFQPHYYRDTPYHLLRKRILYDILGGLDDTVLVKLYPTYRYVDPDPFGGLMKLPENCRYEHLIDFRNFRAAADVLILDPPGSSLAWCWGCGIPLIYIETGMVTLLPEIADRFRQAIFHVDVREPGWERRLKELLELPHAELVARYAAKAEARKRVSEFCVFGPEGAPGRRGADFVAEDAARRWREAAVGEATEDLASLSP